MLLALISDIHGNLPALEAVFKQLDELKPDAILSLGDVVGYGPKPAECVDFLRDRKIQNIMGNHDAGVVGKQDLGLFREPNHSLLKWTIEHLNAEQLQYLDDSPYTMASDELNFLAVHASPSEPSRWRYIQSAIDGRKILTEISQNLCFVGHTHIPAVIPDRLGVFNVKPGVRYIINPGSVGQPRDQDKRASFGLFNFDEFSYKNVRVEFNKSYVYQQFEEIGISMETAKRLMP
ncbi:metallophosphoesterase [bacterium]|nr:MAG: metallophosphoesterase [bacterium]